MRFIARFRFYSPFNEMSIHIQMPGANVVCTALKWQRDYHREIKLGARPIVILQPMGQILFVFDASDTAPIQMHVRCPAGLKIHSRCAAGRSADNWH